MLNNQRKLDKKYHIYKGEKKTTNVVVELSMRPNEAVVFNINIRYIPLNSEAAPEITKSKIY